MFASSSTVAEAIIAFSLRQYRVSLLGVIGQVGPGGKYPQQKMLHSLTDLVLEFPSASVSCFKLSRLKFGRYIFHRKENRPASRDVAGLRANSATMAVSFLGAPHFPNSLLAMSELELVFHSFSFALGHVTTR